ncbi:MAG TPA: diguanylate cyclase [bacterium]|nr:diguanylate cyclase [bacterium]HPS29133.1 diguanylate cyclase [bacterium]
MDYDFCKLVVKESPVGYAYHKTILDETGKPVDYILLEANDAFEKLTGLKLEHIKGKKVTEFLPGIKDSEFDWIGICGEVALKGISKEFEQYSEQLKKWYKVKVHSIEKGYFGTYFFDITGEKGLSQAAESFFRNSFEKIDFRKMTDYILQISSAKYAVFNIYEENGNEYTSMAFSGLNNIVEKVSAILGFNIVGKKWGHDSARASKIAENTITRFENFHLLTGGEIPDPVVLLLEKTFNPGDTFIVKIVKDSRMIGDFTLFFGKEQSLENQGLVELYAKLAGLFISRKKAEEELKKSHERYMLAVAGNQDGIWDWDIATGDLFLSERWKAIVGYSDYEIPNAHGVFQNLLHPDDKKRVRDYFDSYLKGEFSQYNIEFRMKHKDGSYRWILARGAALTDKNGIPYRMAGSHTDITEKKETEKKLETLASTDDLTGMWNRRYFFEIGKIEFSRSKRYQASFSLIMIDIDHFKNTNDRFGHAAGDETLKNISAVLKKNLRDVDLIARMGGEEFAALLPNTEISGALIVAERLRKAVEETPLLVEDKTIPSTISIGISGYKNSSSLDELLKNADAALYIAKNEGRNCIRISEADNGK